MEKDSGKFAEADVPAEIPLIQDELQALMERLIEIDPDAITRIEAIFQKVRSQLACERSFH